MRLASRLASLAHVASMSRNARPYSAFSHRPVRNADGGGGDGGKTPTTPAKDPPAGDGAKALSQEDVDRAVAREKTRAAREAADLKARLAEYEARDAEQAEKAKTSGDQAAADAKLKRDLERTSKERDEAKTLANERLARYHGSLIHASVSSAMVGLEFVGADAADVVESKLRSLAKVEAEGDVERVYLVDGKTEVDLSKREAVASWIRSRFPSLIKAQSGSGAPHGAGAGGAGVDFAKMTPTEKIAWGLNNPGR